MDDTEPHVRLLAYSVPEAAKAISVSTRTMWSLLRVGKLTSKKLGARTIIRAEVLRAYLDQLPDR
jgi:excisionase family DNA binding protein